MGGLCPTPGTGAGFLSSVLAHLDCQAQTIGASGYQALASTGSSVNIALTSLLTIFVAILGIRMALGRVASLSDLTLAVFKIGCVLLLATSWPAYRIIAYDLLLHGPIELFGEIGQASALPGANGGLVARLQRVDDGVLLLIAAGSGRLDIGARASGVDELPGGPAPISDDTAFGLARTAYVAGIIAAVGIIRLVGGLLLAIGPFFAGFLLFGATRSFFAGWLRSLLAVGIGALATSLVLSVELAVLEPWLAHILALRADRVATPFAPFELMALGTAFVAILFGALFACARLSFSSELASWIAERAAPLVQSLTPQARPAAPDLIRGFLDGPEAPSRAYRTAQAVTALERRQAGSDGRSPTTPGEGRSDRTPEQMRRTDSTVVAVPLGQTYRRTAPRVSAVATRRSAGA